MTAIAVIGGGAAGLGAARTLLQEGAEVTLFERGPRLGGNCVGLPVQGTDGRRHVVDVGVSDFNRVTFTEVAALIEDLGLETIPVRQDTHFGTPEGRSLWACVEGNWSFRESCPDADAVVREIATFRKRALEVLRDPRFATCTLGEHLDHVQASRTFREAFLYPCTMGAFPMPDAAPSAAHARSLVRFRAMHGLVADGPSDRRVVVGGMHRYVRAFQRWFVGSGGALRCATHAQRVRRRARGVEVDSTDACGATVAERFDAVVLAGPPGESLALLADASVEERAALASVRVQRARVVVHSDPRLMGDDRSLWGAYNFLVPRGSQPPVRPTITFWPNRLASLPSAVPDVFVSMNPHREPDPDSVLASRTFSHPIGCVGHERAAARVERLQGARHTAFAGAYLRSPFVHESAYTSGIAAARALLGAASATRVAS